MNNQNHTASAAASQSPDETPSDPGFMFQPFLGFHPAEADSALLRGDAVMRFANQARAIASGVETILELRAADESNAEAGAPQLLNRYHMGALERFAIVALGALVDNADDLMDWAGDVAKRGAA